MGGTYGIALYMSFANSLWLAGWQRIYFSLWSGVLRGCFVFIGELKQITK